MSGGRSGRWQDLFYRVAVNANASVFRAAPARGVAPGAHQEIELPPLHLLLEQPEPRLLTDVEQFVHGFVRLAQLDRGPIFLIAQYAQALPDCPLVDCGDVRAGQSPQVLQDLAARLL